MRRVTVDVISQYENLFVQALLHHRRHILRRVTSPTRKIRSAHIADEQSVASEKLRWSAGILARIVFRLGGQNANTLRRMTRSFHDAQRHVTNRQLITIFDGAMRESRAGFLAKNNFGSGFVGEFPMAADKI